MITLTCHRCYPSEATGNDIPNHRVKCPMCHQPLYFNMSPIEATLELRERTPPKDIDALEEMVWRKTGKVKEVELSHGYAEYEIRECIFCKARAVQYGAHYQECEFGMVWKSTELSIDDVREMVYNKQKER